ncbi:MAG: GerMN domain-containing protein [Clostridium sp.]|nr:GerMN domain-containing protein [Clostridium sp.]
MKKILRILCVLGMALLCACAQDTEQHAEYYLYFLPSSASYGSALAVQPWEGSGTPLNEELMQDLLDGPTQEGLKSPFPRGLTLQSLEVEGNTICITLSEHYSGLTDMSQTLADACIVMTLCQLTGVEAVEISTDGFWASRPASRTLTPEQLELSSLLP